MDFANEFKKALDIIKLDARVSKDVSQDKGSWQFGLLVVAIGGLLSGIASYISVKATSSVFDMLGMSKFAGLAKQASIGSIFGSIVGSIIGIFIMVGIIFIFAKMFKGKSAYMELFGPLSYTSLLGWLAILNIIPIIGGLIAFAAGIWSIIVWIYIVKNVCALSTGKAVAVVLIPIAILIVLAIIIVAIAAAIIAAGLASAMM